jgi:hypothetical protein
MGNKAKSEVNGFVYFAVGVAALGGLLFGYDRACPQSGKARWTLSGLMTWRGGGGVVLVDGGQIVPL